MQHVAVNLHLPGAAARAAVAGVLRYLPLLLLLLLLLPLLLPRGRVHLAAALRAAPACKG